MLLPAFRCEYGGCGDETSFDYALKVAFVYDMNMWQIQISRYAKYHLSKDFFVFGYLGGVFFHALDLRGDPGWKFDPARSDSGRWISLGLHVCFG